MAVRYTQGTRERLANDWIVRALERAEGVPLWMLFLEKKETS